MSCLELLKADHHVGDLHAGVVDVVLHFDRVAAELQRAHQRVAERGVAKVADVRRLVRIDGGVLDDRLLRPRGRRRQRARQAEPGQEKGRAIEKHVEVAVGRGVDTGHTGDRPQGARQFLRDRARCLAQPARQVEGHRRSQIAERAVGRVFDRNCEVGVGDAVQPG